MIQLPSHIWAMDLHTPRLTYMHFKLFSCGGYLRASWGRLLKKHEKGFGQVQILPEAVLVMLILVQEFGGLHGEMGERTFTCKGFSKVRQ